MSRPTRLQTTLLLAPPCVLTLWLHLSVFFTRWTDENVHLYVASRVAQGAVLYRDIHSARPPLALAPLVAGLWAGVDPLWTARISLVLCVFATAAVLFWAGRALFGEWQGGFAAALFLLMPEAMARSAWTGIHLVALGTLVCVVLALRGRPFTSGVAGGLALASGQHSVVLVAGAALLVLARSRRDLLRFLGGAVAGLGATLGVAALRAGPQAIWEDLAARHLYHLQGATPVAEGDLAFFLKATALENVGWLVLVLAAVGVATSRQRAIGALVVAHLLVVSSMSGGLVLYLFPAVPLIALLSGAGLHAVWVMRRRFVALTVVAASTLGGWYFARELYERRDARAYAFLPPVRQVTMARMQRLVVVDRLAELTGAMLREGETIYGAPPLASALALKLRRRYAAELADLAPRWIAMGLVSRKSIIEAIEADHVRLFVAHVNAFEHDPVFREYLARCYGEPLVLERVTDDGNGIPRVSAWLHLDGQCLASHETGLEAQ